jgi:hypothetical protein
MGAPPGFCKAEDMGAFWFELLLAEPKALAVVEQNLDSGRPSVAEDKGPAVHRIPLELLATDGR